MNETNVKLVKRQSYSLETKLRLIKEHRKGEETFESLAEKHFIEKKTFRRWIKDEKSLKKKLKNLPPNLAKWKRLRLTKYMRLVNSDSSSRRATL